jgi:hypothetical protein
MRTERKEKRSQRQQSLSEREQEIRLIKIQLGIEMFYTPKPTLASEIEQRFKLALAK